MPPKSTEELEAERLATEEATRVAAEAETARLAAEAEAAKNTPAKTAEELEAERLAAEAAEAETARLAAEAAKAPKPDWRDERLAKTAAQKAELAERLAKYETPDGKPREVPAGDLLPKAEVDRLANERAAQIAERNIFNQDCNNAAAEGRKTYPDFDASVKALGRLIDPEDPNTALAYDELLAAGLETGELPKIIYQLGRDLDTANEVMKLSPVKRAAKLAALASADAQQVSNLPAPITPVKGKHSGPSEISPSDPTRADNLSSAEWHARRQREVDSNAPGDQRRRA